jgi:UPF0271 protein
VKVLVLDTSAFVMGFNPLSVDLEVFTVPAVERELFQTSMAMVRFSTSRSSGKLEVREPSEPSKSRIREESLKLGEKIVLSEADSQILALALDLRANGLEPVVVSDDYAIQNMAERLNVAYASLATFGISYEFNWISYCPACFRRYPQTYQLRECQVCGTMLKRKVLRKVEAKKKL